MSTRFVIPFCRLAAILIATSVAPRFAAAQDPCAGVTVTPSHPSAGQAFEICGPSGSQYYYSWRNTPTDAAPFSTSRCVTFPSGLAAGTYSWEHTYSVDANGNGPDASDPYYKCLVEVTVSGAPGTPSCFGTTFTPNDSVCAGQSIVLCAPAGDGFYYSWRDENDQMLTTDRCVTVSRSAGCYEYELTISDDLTGNGPSADDPFVTCPVTVCFEACDGDGDFANCPRSPGFWKQQCRQRDNGSTKFTREQMDQITAAIDARSAFFGWAGSFDAFCEIVGDPGGDARDKAVRQYVVALANLAVGELDLVAHNGAELGLDLDTPITCDGEATTIGDLLDLADTRFGILGSMSLDDDDVREEYDRFASCLERINLGDGIGATCCDDDDEEDDGDRAHHGGNGNGNGNGKGNGHGDGNGDGHGNGDDEDEDCEEDGDGDDDADDDATLPDAATVRVTPNPLLRATQVSYRVNGAAAMVEISVHDLAGREIRSLVRQSQPAGRYEVGWDGRDAEGAAVRSGVYFLRGRIGDERVHGRVLVVR
jgi:hypothetical protein